MAALTTTTTTTTQAGLDFEKAARHAEWVVKNGDGKKKSYLMANFDITQKEKEQVAPADLVKVVAKAFTASQDPKKLEHASKIFTQLIAMAPTSTTPALVKQFLPVLEKARLKEIPRQLSMLLQAKQIIRLMCSFPETAFSCIRSETFMREYYANTDRTGYFNIKNAPKREELLEILETTEGLALSQRFPMLFNGQGTFYSKSVTPDEHRLLKAFIDRSSGMCSPYAAKFYWFVESNKDTSNYNSVLQRLEAFPSSLAFVLPTTNYRTNAPGSKEPNPYYESNSQPFFAKACPAFVALLQFYSQQSDDFKLDICSSAYHRFVQTFFDRCKKAVSGIGELNATYRALFDEFDTLNRKYAPTDAPLPALSPSCFPTIEREDGAPLVFPALPSPDEYAAIPCTLAITDFSTSYPRLPEFKPLAKPTPASAPVSALAATSALTTTSTSIGGETVAPPTQARVEEKAVRQESKGEEAPRRSSVFDRRTFTFSEKDQRVLDWETNPERHLALAPYNTMSSQLQKVQTWRHGCCVLDPFVGTSYSRKGEWTNNRGEKQTAYFIQAEVEYQGKTARCVFQYAFDKDKVLYHRYAGERSNIQIVDDLMAKNRYESDFPTLDKSFELFKEKPKAVKVDVPGEAPYTIDPLDVITVKDPKYDLVIRIFRQG